MPTSICIPASPMVKAGAPTSGVRQVETAVVVGTITLAGNATFTITSGIVVGSPLAVSVAVALNDTASQVAAKAATKLNATAAVSSKFVATSNNANLILTALQSAANDANLNIAFTNDTCTGLTPDASSDNTTAGVKGDYRGAETGSVCTDTTNYAIYQNTGTTLSPTWTEI